MRAHILYVDIIQTESPNKNKFNSSFFLLCLKRTIHDDLTMNSNTVKTRCLKFSLRMNKLKQRYFRTVRRRFGKNVNISGCEQQGCSVINGCGDSASSCRTLEATGSAVGSGGGDSGTGGVQPAGQTQSSTHATSAPAVQQRPSSISTCLGSCCAESAKKVDCISNVKLKSWIIETECRLNETLMIRLKKREPKYYVLCITYLLRLAIYISYPYY